MLSHYNSYLSSIMKNMGSDITYNTTLLKEIKKSMIRDIFVGIFPQNINTKIFNKYEKCCAILNTSTSTEEGEHWKTIRYICMILLVEILKDYYLF